MITDQKISAIVRARRSLNKKMSLAFLLLVAAIVVAGIALWRIAEAERARDTYNWQVRLNLIVDNQTSGIRSWLNGQFAVLSNLAENPSLQLYVTELEIMGRDAAAVLEEEPAEGIFLRNLLSLTARKSGFAVAQSDQEKIPANVKATGAAGMAIINNQKRILVSTLGMPEIDPRLQDFIASLPKGEQGMLDIYIAPSGRPTMAFAVPIYQVQSDQSASQQLGIVMGVKPVDVELYALLAAPESQYTTQESTLIREANGSVEYISPLSDGKPLLHRVARNMSNLTASEALTHPGQFLQARDYRFHEVLFTSRKVPNTAWTLIHKIDREEAMSESDARIQRLAGMFILSVLVVLIGLLAAWRHGSSLKSEKVALRYKHLFGRYKSQEHLLRLVSDNQPDGMFLVDQENRYIFSNYIAAKHAGITRTDVIGKTMGNVIGPNKARHYQEMNAKALSMKATVSRIDHVDGQIILSKHIPLTHIPFIAEDHDVVETPQHNISGVLVVEHDITELVHEREKQERTFRELIDSLVALVDRHDPFASHHSSRVAAIARAIAEEMDLEPEMVEAAEIAGRLMNLGKILLPTALLTKKDALNKKEIKTVHESIYETAKFLEHISFEGPVAETLQQCLENWDGSGPKRLKGEDIIITARIVAVANAFVAMLSPRSYREKMSQNEVLEYLLEQSGKKFQRSIVAALINYIENRGGEERLEEEPPQDEME